MSWFSLFYIHRSRTAVPTPSCLWPGADSRTAHAEHQPNPRDERRDWGTRNRPTAPRDRSSQAGKGPRREFRKGSRVAWASYQNLPSPRSPARPSQPAHPWTVRNAAGPNRRPTFGPRGRCSGPAESCWETFCSGRGRGWGTHPPRFRPGRGGGGARRREAGSGRPRPSVSACAAAPPSRPPLPRGGGAGTGPHLPLLGVAGGKRRGREGSGFPPPLLPEPRRPGEGRGGGGEGRRDEEQEDGAGRSRACGKPESCCGRRRRLPAPTARLSGGHCGPSSAARFSPPHAARTRLAVSPWRASNSTSELEGAGRPQVQPGWRRSPFASWHCTWSQRSGDSRTGRSTSGTAVQGRWGGGTGLALPCAAPRLRGARYGLRLGRGQLPISVFSLSWTQDWVAWPLSE